MLGQNEICGHEPNLKAFYFFLFIFLTLGLNSSRRRVYNFRFHQQSSHVPVKVCGRIVHVQ